MKSQFPVEMEGEGRKKTQTGEQGIVNRFKTLSNELLVPDPSSNIEDQENNP